MNDNTHDAPPTKNHIYKYITIKEHGTAHQRPYYQIINDRSGDILGTIEYYSRWRQYVAEFSVGAVFNASCLTDIAHFLTNYAGK